MTLNELVEVLTCLAETEGGREVRIALQPNYPLAADLAAITLLDGKVWLAASDADGYTSGLAWAGDDIEAESETAL